MVEQQYVTSGECEAHHDALMREVGEIKDCVNDIKRVIIGPDNGNTCHQTRLDRHEQILTRMMWGISLVGGAVLLGASRLLWKAVVSII